MVELIFDQYLIKIKSLRGADMADAESFDDFDQSLFRLSLFLQKGDDLMHDIRNNISVSILGAATVVLVFLGVWLEFLFFFFDSVRFLAFT